MKNNLEFILDTYFYDFVKVIKVNNNTGEFQFLRKCPEEEDAEALGIHTIDAYAEQIVAKQMRTQNAVENIIFHSKSSYLKRLKKSGACKSVHTDVYHIGDQYLWLTCRISIPVDFSEENPWYLITWKPTEDETEAIAAAMVIFATGLYKVLKVNLTQDLYEIVKVKEGELNRAIVSTQKISDWWRLFTEQGYVYEEDRSNYDRFTDLTQMRRELREGQKFLRCRYRRKTDGNFRWVSMEIIPALEYTNENQIVMLYVRDIQDDYISEVIRHQELERICFHDSATGLRNRLYYNRLCDRFSDGCENSVGVVFADLNALKYVNDNYGHTEGDKYIQDFARLLSEHFGIEHSYRISGDEFIVVLESITEDEFARCVDGLHKIVQKMETPIAAIGSSYASDGIKKLEELASLAERHMYSDKEQFYQKHPNYGRRKMVLR